MKRNINDLEKSLEKNILIRTGLSILYQHGGV